MSPIKDKRIRIICGHYGSGKSEFSVNYANSLNKTSAKVALIDLDVVNPYFRSREKTDELTEKGILVISSSIKGSNADLPSLAGNITTPIFDSSFDTIIDVGGDHVGARVLGRYKDDILENEYDMFIVVNANRPETQKADQVISYIKAIEVSSGLKISGIINNTHLLKSTTHEDIINGYNLSKEVACKLNIDVRYNSCMKHLIEGLPQEIKENSFPISMYLREDWMS